MLKGEHKTLNVTEISNHRIMVGLGWDPTQGVSILNKISDIISGKKPYHDLDLACFLLTSDYNVFSHVSADPKKSIDHTGKVYHSGDNIEGYGEGDDEEISVELKNLSPKVEHIVFTVDIQTGHDFTEILNPEIRLVDGYSGHNFLHARLTNEKAIGKPTYLFAHIYRTDNSWTVHYLDEYLNSASYENRIIQIKKHIQT